MNTFTILTIANQSSAPKQHCAGLPSPTPSEAFARALMSHPDFLAYIHKHGYHFTAALADFATKLMTNDDGSTHNWTTAQVQSAMQSAGMKNNPLNATWGDAAYLANMHYADKYPDIFSSETACIKAAYKDLNDKDGYEGITFYRWLADVVGKQLVVDWTAMD